MKKYLMFASLVIAGSFGLLSFTSNRPIPAVPAPAAGYKVGDIAKDFRLKNVDGHMLSLADVKDAKGFIVVFTCNHCPVAKQYESRIEALDKRYASKGYPVIAINPTDPVAYPDDTYEKMVSYAQEHHYSFPYLDDESQEITKTYGATNTPHVFVLNRQDGKLVVRYVGAIDDNAQEAAKAKSHYVADAVDALLAGKPILTMRTKAIGCGIKMKNS